MNDVFWWAAQNTVTIAILVPVVWIACRLRQSRPAEQHLLWLLLLVKLVTPPIVMWPWSAEEMRAWTAVRNEARPDESAILDERAVLPSVVALEKSTIASVPAASLEPPEPAVVGVPHRSVEPSSPAPTTVAGRIRADDSVERWLPGLAAAIWLIGAVAVGWRIAFQARRQHVLLRTARDAPAELQAVVDRVSARLGIGHVGVRVSSQTAAPFVSCLGRPVLVWPTAHADAASLAAGACVIAHELAHIRRRDHWVAWLEAVATPLWWWNPVLWYVRRRLDETRELSCDALALELTATDRRTFAELLLAFSTSGRPALPFAPLRTGIAPRHPLKRRLAMLFDKRVSGRVSSAGLMLTGLLAIAALPGWAWGQEEPTEPAPATVASEATEIDSQTPAAAPTATTTEPAAAASTTPARAVAPAGTASAPAAPSDAVYAPAGAPLPADSAALPPTTPRAESNSRSSEQEFDVDGDTIVRLRPAPDGTGVILMIIERGQPAGEVTLPGVTLQSSSAPDDGFRTMSGGRGSAGAAPLTRTVPSATGRPARPAPRGISEMMIGGAGSFGMSRMSTAMPDRAATTEIQLLKNALQLAELEVEEKAILVEQGRLKNDNFQKLANKGVISDVEGTLHRHDLRLLEIDLKKAKLQAEQARIRLEAAQK